MKLTLLMKKRESAKAKNHQKYFIGNTGNRMLMILPVLVFLLGVFMSSLNLPTNFFDTKGLKKDDLVLINYLSLGCFSVSFLLALIHALIPRNNLKGVLIDIEDDLVPDVHYGIESINGDMCNLVVIHPERIPALHPWTNIWKLEQLAQQFDVDFKPGLIFGKRKDGTFYFVQPEPTKGKAYEKATTCA